MEHWQFLIQKQGNDCTWRPLESPNLEIIEGRYRVVARSHRPNIDVEVRVTHSSMQEVPQKQVLLKRKRRTNSEGLTPIIPFTDLTPGILELRCFGDLMADMFGKSWEHSVLLQVISSSSMVLTNSEELAIPTQMEAVLEDTIINQPVSPVWSQARTAEQIIQELLNFSLPVSESLLEDEIIPDHCEVVKPLLPLLLTLEQDNYIARWGQNLTINGQVRLKDLDETSGFESVCASEIQIKLYSPQELEVFNQVRQPLAEKLLPFTIISSIEVPADCQSKLILGDISLYGVLDGVGEKMLLANHCFTIVAEITELLIIATRQIEPSPSDQLALPPATEATIAEEPPASLKLELLNLVKTVKTPISLAFQPAVRKALPSQINQRQFRRRKSAVSYSPQLPQLPGSKSPPMPALPFTLEKDDITQTSFPFLRRQIAPSVEHEVDSELVELEVNQEVNGELTKFENIPEENLLEENISELPIDDAEFTEDKYSGSPELFTVDNSIDNSYVSPLIQKWIQSQGYSLLEPISVEYEDYYASSGKSNEIVLAEVKMPKLEDAKTESSTSVESETEEFPAENTEIDFPISTPFSSHQPQKLPAWVAQEVVVDDTPVETVEEPSATNLPLSWTANTPFTFTESLPVPQLYVPEGELISGKLVMVRVQLPEIRPNTGVKLWVKDYQTRWLMDGPHLLTNLLPNHLGCLEVLTQLQIPFGCLEIRLEAIAVDLTTDQESDKAMVVKSVIPPDLPSLQLDELLGI